MLNYCALTALYITWGCANLLTANANSNITMKAIQQLLLDEKYERALTPKSGPDGERPLQLYVRIIVYSVGSVNVEQMDYSMDILLQQQWHDPRLIHHNASYSISSAWLKKKLWLSDLYFRNAKAAKRHSVTTDNELLFLSSDGTVTYSQKISLTLSCPMNLWKYPLDQQVCPIYVSSFGQPSKTITLKWWGNRADEHVQLQPDLVMNEFAKPKLKTSLSKETYQDVGTFSVAVAEIYLNRKTGFYLLYTYLPSVLIVAISWISFWIDYTAVPARISIGLLSVLALVTQTSAIIQKLPRVSYVKAIDIWLFVCLSFVVVSMLEFAVIHIMIHKHKVHQEKEEKRKAEAKDDKENGVAEDEESASLNLEKFSSTHLFRNGLKLAKRIEFIFFICYPVFFTFFAMVYSTFYSVVV